MAQIRFMHGGTLRTATRIRIMDGGTIRTVQRVRAMVSGVLRTVYQYFTGNISSAVVTGSYGGASATPQDITTSLVLASASGGVAPFTYAWSRTDGGPNPWTILSPTSASTAFKATGVGAGTAATGSFQCVITDSTGATATTASVSAEAYNNSTA